jgi:hypothetical protein
VTPAHEPLNLSTTQGSIAPALIPNASTHRTLPFPQKRAFEEVGNLIRMRR